MALHPSLKQLCAVACSILVLASVTLASDSIRFKIWNTENGLPQNSVISIAQTPDGYIWLATFDGLARFDGVRFKVFKKLDAPELPTNRLQGLLVDASGRLWILTEDVNIIVMYENGRFIKFTKDKDFEADNLSEPWRLKKTEMVFRAGDIDYIYDKGAFRRESARKRNLPKVFADASDSIWIDAGEAFYKGKQGKLDHYSKQEVLPPNTVATYHRDAVEIDESIWFIMPFDTPSAGRDPNLENSRLARLKNGELTIFPIKANESSALQLDRHGNLWIGSFKHGVTRIEKETVAAGDPLNFPSLKITTDVGLTDLKVREGFVDQTGNLWFCTERGLLLLKDTSPITVHSIEDGLPSANIYSVIEDRAGRIWFGAWDLDLVRYEQGKFYSEPFDLVTALFEDRDSRLWVGNRRLWYRDGNKWTLPVSEPSDLNSDIVEVDVISQDREGSIWYGGTNRGIARYREKSERRYTTADGLPGNSVTAFLQTADGMIWVGTSSGLARLEGDRFVSFTTAQGLGGNYIRSLYEDRDGSLWIGGYDGGITRFRNGQFKSITSRQGLFSDGVFCILEDNAGWFWMNSNQGIHRTRRQDLNDVADGRLSSLTSISYGPEDGLKNIEGNGGKQPAGIKASDGKLWIPTAGGIAVIDPSLARAESGTPRVMLEEIRIDQKEVTYRNGITVGPGQTALEINYTGISFVNADQVRFKYRLEGLDSEWTEAGVRRTAYFSHLPYGEYTFRVMAANRDGVWAEKDASVRVLVKRPFHRTTGFYALVSVLIVGAVGFLYFVRVNQLRKLAGAREDYARQLIEAQELERSRIAMELHDSLGQILAVIRTRALLGLSTPENHHRIVDQMKEISESAAAALQETRDIARELHPYQLQHLGLAEAVRSLVDRVAEASEIKFTVNVEEIDPHPTNEVAIAVYRIVQESLSNIIKHSGAKNVSLSLLKTDGNLELRITDDGHGFTRGEIREGLGMRGIEQRAKMIGAHVVIESETGKGTRIVLLVSTR